MKPASHSSAPVYRDKWPLWIGVPLITAFTQYLTYEQIRLNWLLLYELTSDALKIYVVWQVIRWTVRWLDDRFPWQQNFTSRLLLQLALSWFLASLVLTVLVFMDYWLVRPYPNERYFSFDLVIASLFILLVNAVYVGLYFYDLSMRAAYKPADDEAAAVYTPNTFLVRLGKRDHLLAQPDILCFYSDEKETYLLTKDERLFSLDTSLDKLTAQLDHALFFRISRKYIVAAALIDQLQPEANGRLLLELKPSARLPRQVVVSRAKATAFRQWLRTYHSSAK